MDRGSPILSYDLTVPCPGGRIEQVVWDGIVARPNIRCSACEGSPYGFENLAPELSLRFPMAREHSTPLNSDNTSRKVAQYALSRTINKSIYKDTITSFRSTA